MIKGSRGRAALSLSLFLFFSTLSPLFLPLLLLLPLSIQYSLLFPPFLSPSCILALSSSFYSFVLFFIYLLPPSFLFSLFILFLLSTLFFHPYTTSNYCSLAFIPTPPLHPSSFRLVLPASPPSSPFPLPLPHPPPRSPHPSASVREERRKRLARNAIYSASRKQ